MARLSLLLTLIAAALLTACQPVYAAAPTIVQARVNCHSASNVVSTCTYGTNPTTGSSDHILLMVGVSGNNDPNTTFGIPRVSSCTGAGSVARLGGSAHASTQWGEVYWAPVNSSTSCSITWGCVGSNNPAGSGCTGADGAPKGMTIYELSGMNAVTQPDGACTAAQVSAFSSPGPVTVAMSSTATAADFLIGAILSADVSVSPVDFNFAADTAQATPAWTADTGLTGSGALNMNWYTEYFISSTTLTTPTAGWSTVTQHAGGGRDLNVIACALAGAGGGGGTNLNMSIIRIGGGSD